MQETAQQETIQLLAQIWQRNQLQVLDRIIVLERAAQAAEGNVLQPSLRADAISIAHKLAGSLGMFGFKEGTRLAREIECALGSQGEKDHTLSALTADLRNIVFPARLPNPPEENQSADCASMNQSLAS